MRYGLILGAALLTAPASAQVEYELESGLSADALSAALSGPTTHLVESGDTLSALAGRYYGDMALWPAIFDANADLIGHPTEIAVGMELTIPGLDDALAYEGGAPGPRESAADRLERMAEEAVPETEADQGPPPWMYFEGISRAIRREYMTFENAGRIAYVDPDLKEGDFIEAGHVIAYQDQRRPGAQIENAEAQIVNARSQLAVHEATRMEAQANLTLAQRTFERYRVLLEQNSASQQEYDQAQAQLESARAGAMRADRQIEAARAQIAVGEASLATATVTRDESYLIAPISGLIARHNIEQGDYYTPQMIQAQSEQQLFNTIPVILIDPSRFEISVNVPSERYDLLRVGEQALIAIVDQDATLEERLPDEYAGPAEPPDSYPIEGVVHSVSPVMDTNLRNFNVTVHTTRGHERLRDGETVSLWIRSAQ